MHYAAFLCRLSEKCFLQTITRHKLSLFHCDCMSSHFQLHWVVWYFEGNFLSLFCAGCVVTIAVRHYTFPPHPNKAWMESTYLCCNVKSAFKISASVAGAMQKLVRALKGDRKPADRKRNFDSLHTQCTNSELSLPRYRSTGAHQTRASDLWRQETSALGKPLALFKRSTACN